MPRELHGELFYKLSPEEMREAQVKLASAHDLMVDAEGLEDRVEQDTYIKEARGNVSDILKMLRGDE